MSSSETYTTSAMDTVLNMVEEIVSMDDMNSTDYMPLAAVILLHEASDIAMYFSTSSKRAVEIWPSIISSLNRSSSRWRIAAVWPRHSSPG